MKFIIHDKIFKQFPGLKIGVVIAQDIDNRDSHESEQVRALLDNIQNLIRENYHKSRFSEEPKIAAWRKAYSSFGAKPKKYKCSVENLYRMILDGKELRSINNIVDIYNYVSLRNMLPIGGDDLDKIEGDIMLTIAKGDERFTPLGGNDPQPPKPGEIIYRDDKDVLCRRWNWRECDKSKMTEKSNNVMLVIEGLSPAGSDDIKKAINELSELIKKVCGGRIRGFILDYETREIEF